MERRAFAPAVLVAAPWRSRCRAGSRSSRRLGASCAQVWLGVCEDSMKVVSRAAISSTPGASLRRASYGVPLHPLRARDTRLERHRRLDAGVDALRLALSR